jgi:hypothetical protein
MNQTFGVGSVLGTSFRVYGRNFVPFTLISALLYVPMILWTSMSSLESFANWKHMALVGALATVLNSFVSATLTYGVVKELQGQRVGIGACLSTGFARMIPALGVALLSGLIIGVGFMLLFVPCVIASCVLYVAMPASVIEKPGIMGALGRSAELTRGYRGAIFGLALILGIVGIVVTYVEKSAFPITLASYKTYLYVNFATTVVFGALGSVVAAVAYSSLRTEKEGTSIDDLAKVFE